MGDTSVCRGFKSEQLETSNPQLALGGGDDAIICMSRCELVIAIGDRS